VTSDAELVLRVVVAGCAGGVIGLEREVRGHDPGIRTHALVAVGAAIFAIAGAFGFTDAVVGGRAPDPTRVAAQVAAGIGFIGAGAVIQSGATVRGITTAATLWVCAAIGVAAAGGLYVLIIAAALTTLLILIVLRLLKPALVSTFRAARTQVRIEYHRGHGTLGPIMRELEARRCRVGWMSVEDDDEACLEPVGIRNVTFIVQTRDEAALASAIARFEQRTEIVSIDIDSSPRGVLRRRPRRR
jgi:putative Mg2+ transporter-C (MgtC) family protein